MELDTHYKKFSNTPDKQSDKMSCTYDEIECLGLRNKYITKDLWLKYVKRKISQYLSKMSKTNLHSLNQREICDMWGELMTLEEDAITLCKEHYSDMLCFGEGDDKYLESQDLLSKLRTYDCEIDSILEFD